MRLAYLLILAPLASACKKVEPAPKELDALLHWFFAEYDTAEDEQAAEAFRNLDAVIVGSALDEHSDGSITDLSREEVGELGPSGESPLRAAGIFMVNPIECSLREMGELVTARNQIELYGTYDELDRSWDNDVEAFRKGNTDRATWFDDFTVTILGATYAATTNGAGRWVPDLGKEDSPFGRALMTRRVMPQTAEFESGDNSYDQDFRAEVYYSRQPGVTIHVAAMWREVDVGGFDQDHEGSQRLVLNGMKDWDDDSEKACGGR
jgi:hypothetical protein